MENIYFILLLFYVSINSFLSGVYYVDDFKDQNTVKGKVISGVWILLVFLFGVFIFTIIITYAIVNRILRNINEYFQVKFFFTFFFTKKWDNLEENKVKEINDFANKKDKSILKNRIYIYCVNLLNKRLEKNKLKNK